MSDATFAPLQIAEVQRRVGAELDRLGPVIDELGARFAKAGEELALVGGPVRDAMLGRLHDDLDFTLTVIGERGWVWTDNFVGPQNGSGTLHVTIDGGPEVVEDLGRTPSYDYQLAAFAAAVEDGTHPGLDARDALAQARYLDAIYTAAGYPLRPSTTL